MASGGLAVQPTTTVMVSPPSSYRKAGDDAYTGHHESVVPARHDVDAGTAKPADDTAEDYVQTARRL